MNRFVLKTKRYWFHIGLGFLVLGIVGLGLVQIPSADAGGGTETYIPFVSKSGAPVANDEYVVIGWNDLGMHCYDLDYSVMAVLPPYNTLWAQVIQRGDPPKNLTTGIDVESSFPDNTYSAGKTNFWDYEDKLFGVDLAPNIGLTGKGLSGEMDLKEDHFEADGIPLTEFSDSSPSTPDYLQRAKIEVNDSQGNLLAQSDVVSPVSSEMRCDKCHTKPDPNNFRMNILLGHDDEAETDLVTQAASGNPVLCADCHADPALDKPGNPELPSLSAVMHEKHKEKAKDCYDCHPGPDTKCLRGTMANDYEMTCTDCHEGGMEALSDEDRTPWMDEPRCDDCHDAQYAENPGKLFRFSTGHGGLYCESCHNSTHAILPSRDGRDNLQSKALQGHAGTIEVCTVCHLTDPGAGGPHK